MKKDAWTKAAGGISEFFVKFRKGFLEGYKGNGNEMFGLILEEESFIEEVIKLSVCRGEEMGKGFRISDLAHSLSLDYIDPDITEDSFPIKLEDRNSKKQYKIFYFGMPMTGKDVITQMKKGSYGRYRPGSPRDLLYWAKDNWNGTDAVAALGQFCLDPLGLPSIVILGRDHRTRGLHLEYSGIIFPQYMQFLGVLE